MNRRIFQFAMWLPWLAVPLMGLRYWMVWDRLPQRMATHFGASGQPNGWMTREVSLEFGLGIMLFLLAVFTAVLYAAHKKLASDNAAWALLGFLYLIVGVVYYGNSSVLEYNLSGQPVQIQWVAVLVPVALLGLLAVFLRSSRGQSLPQQAWLAEEVHASPVFSMIFLMPLVVEVCVLVLVPVPAVRLGVGLMIVLFLVIAAQAWDGFHYRFGAAGVEISTLGFRLRSIPAGNIRQYAVEKWSPWRGYGIRGIGGTRAYVWGNSVVHITTPDGHVYLGHAEPERVIRDLEMIAAQNKSTH